MIDLDAIDLFDDPVVARDPFPLLDHLAQSRHVWFEPKFGVAVVSGYDEVVAVLRDHKSFSSSTITSGPQPSFPVELSGDDITDLVEQYRDELHNSDQIVAFDPPKHTVHRALLMGLITPKRLKENEAFIWRLTDRQLDVVLNAAKCEFIADYAQPYTLTVIADLLGVPEKDHERLLAVSPLEAHPVLGSGVSNDDIPGQLGNSDGKRPEPTPELSKATGWYQYFVDAIVSRRAEPTEDTLTPMAMAKFPDGGIPEPLDLARIATNLFAAGQETTVRLIGAMLHRIASEPELQSLLRQERDLIPRFVEETLRIEGPVKGDFRLARKTTSIGGVEIKAGTQVMVMNAAANRDPKQFPKPTEFSLERANYRSHVAFGFGVHTCAGAPLARSEARITLERLFDRTNNIVLAEAEHGSAESRRFEYLPSYMYRGLKHLYLEFSVKE